MRIGIAGTLAVLSCLHDPRGASAQLRDDLHIEVGGMRPGSGVGGGLEYYSDHFANGLLDVRLESKLSIRLYQQHEMEIVRQHFLYPKVYLRVIGLYRSYTQIDYFGIGPDTVEGNHSNYRLAGPAVLGTVGIRAHRNLQVAARIGYLRVTIGEGTDGNLPSIEERFEPESIPGLVDEPDHYLFGPILTVDSRNDPEDPTTGLYYLIESSAYRDRGFNRYDFQDLELDLRHFVPVTARSTLAVRARGLFTWTADGQTVPFYHLPALGGSDSLHAFENDRFRHGNLFFLSNELRYQATPEIRLEVFVDAGQVAPRADAFRLGALRFSYGIGARYKLGRTVLIGVDAGFGAEGGRVSFKGDFRF